jgi:hypothetical protein
MPCNVESTGNPISVALIIPHVYMTHYAQPTMYDMPVPFKNEYYMYWHIKGEHGANATAQKPTNSRR